jgi:hypothetical protein
MSMLINEHALGCHAALFLLHLYRPQKTIVSHTDLWGRSLRRLFSSVVHARNMQRDVYNEASHLPCIHSFLTFCLHLLIMIMIMIMINILIIIMIMIIILIIIMIMIILIDSNDSNNDNDND